MKNTLIHSIRYRMRLQHIHRTMCNVCFCTAYNYQEHADLSVQEYYEKEYIEKHRCVCLSNQFVKAFSAYYMPLKLCHTCDWVTYPWGLTLYDFFNSTDMKNLQTSATNWVDLNDKMTQIENHGAIFGCYLATNLYVWSFATIPVSTIDDKQARCLRSLQQIILDTEPMLNTIQPTHIDFQTSNINNVYTYVQKCLCFTLDLLFCDRDIQLTVATRFYRLYNNTHSNSERTAFLDYLTQMEKFNVYIKSQLSLYNAPTIHSLVYEQLRKTQEKATFLSMRKAVENMSIQLGFENLNKVPLFLIILFSISKYILQLLKFAPIDACGNITKNEDDTGDVVTKVFNGESMRVDALCAFVREFNPWKMYELFGAITTHISNFLDTPCICQIRNVK